TGASWEDFLFPVFVALGGHRTRALEDVRCSDQYRTTCRGSCVPADRLGFVAVHREPDQAKEGAPLGSRDRVLRRCCHYARRSVWIPCLSLGRLSGPCAGRALRLPAAGALES